MVQAARAVGMEGLEMDRALERRELRNERVTERLLLGRLGFTQTNSQTPPDDRGLPLKAVEPEAT